MERKLQPDRVVGERYRLVECSRRDVFGEVWVARDLRLERPVSVRVLAADICVAPGSSTSVLALAKRLEHSRVASILDLVCEDDWWFLISELTPGQSLAELITAKGPLSPSAAFQLARDIAEGIQAIHLAGGVHGRLDPSRITMFNDRATVTEVGLGMLIGDDSEEWRTTVPDMNDPSIAFLSPEQAAGEGPPSVESDVWAFGAVVYFAMFGAVPYEARTRAMLAVATARKLPSLEGARDRSLGALVRPCLAREPALRPSLDEVLDDVRAALGPVITSTDVSTPGASISLVDAAAFRPPSRVELVPRPVLFGGIFALFLVVGLVVRPGEREPAAASGGLPALATDPPPKTPAVEETASASVSPSASVSSSPHQIVVRPPIRLSPAGTVAH